MLQGSPYFFLDAYYIHETPSVENDCDVSSIVICLTVTSVYNLAAFFETIHLAYIYMALFLEPNQNAARTFSLLAKTQQSLFHGTNCPKDCERSTASDYE